MNNGESVQVSVAGEDLLLPLSMYILRQLGKAGVCPIYLSGIAAMEGRGMVLDLGQACSVLAIGMQAAGLSKTTPEQLWLDARKRDRGCAELGAMATAYLSAFIRDMPDLTVPAEAAGVPKV